jgi:hypothetical protein
MLLRRLRDQDVKDYNRVHFYKVGSYITVQGWRTVPIVSLYSLAVQVFTGT